MFDFSLRPGSVVRFSIHNYDITLITLTVLVLSMAFPVQAYEDYITFHGFVSQGYMVSTDNNYPIAETGGSTTVTMRTHSFIFTSR